MHKSSYQKMQAFRRRYLAEREREPLRILDVGSQDVNGSYRAIFDAPRWSYCGLDMAPGPNVDVVLRAPYRWSALASDSFDVVVSGQALEHVEFFWITILEMQRVLRAEGLLCLIVPSAGYEHRYPVDCWRFYPDGLRALARWARLQVLEASTEWRPDGYGDGSEEWKDSLLVCRKERLPLASALRRRATDLVLLSALRDAVKRHRW
jgi:SAM-dependent methyltransferase